MLFGFELAERIYQIFLGDVKPVNLQINNDDNLRHDLIFKRFFLINEFLVFCRKFEIVADKSFVLYNHNVVELLAEKEDVVQVFSEQLANLVDVPRFNR